MQHSRSHRIATIAPQQLHDAADCHPGYDLTIDYAFRICDPDCVVYDPKALLGRLLFELSLFNFIYSVHMPVNVTGPHHIFRDNGTANGHQQ
jgi:hypothetical protein